MPEHPSISGLTELINQYDILVSIVRPCSFASDWFEVELCIGSNKFALFIDDEYRDFRYESPELTLCVVLKSLEELNDSSDFLNWCHLTGADGSNKVALDYYKSAIVMISQIEVLIGLVNSYISDLDFSLDTGAAQNLRSNSSN